jgi:hypothetical protein
VGARLGTTAPLRLVRGTVVGLCAVVLGAGGHVLVSGMTPSALSLVMVTVAAVAVAVAMSGRRWRLSSLFALLGGAQLVFHVLLSGGTGHSMADMHQQTVGGLSQSSVMMVGAHAAAALVSAALLERGEQWCWQLVELLTRPLRVTTLAPVPAHARLDVIRESTSPIPRRQVWLTSQLRRGPPAARVS